MSDTSTGGHVCPECGTRNATTTGPCASCRSTAYRGDRDRAKPGETYDKVAGVVGLVPNTRWKDNLYQGLFVLGTAALGALGGYVLEGTCEGALAGTALGLVVGGLLSGVALMVLGVVRAIRTRR